MRLRSGDRFFDFDGDIEIERQWKLFEKIDETVGDFSYQFEIERTDNNMSILGFPTPDAVKSIYKSVPCDILDEDGIPFYTGQIRVENVARTISCSYFSGNFNWMSLLNGFMSELNLSQYDRESSRINIRNSWQNDSGVIFPLLDTGLLTSRKRDETLIDDYTLCIFVKTIFEKITAKTGVKFTGDLFKDPVFNSLILCRNTQGKKDIEDRSSFANLTSDQAFTAIDAGGGTTITVEFNDDSTLPYYNGAQNNYDASTFEYTADVAMRAELEAEFSDITYASGSLDELGYVILVNGTVVAGYGITIGVGSVPGTNTGSLSFRNTVQLEAGDVVKVQVNAGTISGTTSVTVKAGSTFKVTPVRLLYTSGVNLVPPNWTNGQFVSNIMNLFCCISDFDQATKTVTINFFNDLASKDPIDLSDYLTIEETNFTDVLSNYSKTNTLSYQEGSDEEIAGYNASSFARYGAGVIEINNDFISDSGAMVEVDFTSPISYINPAFRCSMERVPFFTAADQGSTPFDRVVYAAGSAAFHLPPANDFLYIEEGDLVRISESDNDLYNGEFRVSIVTSDIGSSIGRHIILGGLNFSADATGKVTKLIHKPTGDDSVYLFYQTEYDADQVPEYSSRSEFAIAEKGGATIVDDVAYPYFNLLNTGNTINDQYKQSLAYGEVDNDFSYQRTLIDSYWRNVERILNDPTKPYAKALLPKNVFMSLTPLRPIRVRTKETDNLYYLNRITGYKKSYKECDVELIKLP